ncbi:MAG: N-acetylmuramoyl-L-alanine amidase [Deltaproteobacteria bacterium]|nr:N-acetylmuramoyl-L-alanine amidase [Deltaproteobacteria bacterium]
MLILLAAALTTAPCIALDAGHGGPRDDGTTALEHKEKMLALQLVRRVRDALKGSLAGYDVVLTRDEDKELSLIDRARIANKAGCRALISVHINGSVEPVMHGIEAYSLDTQKQRYIRRVGELASAQASDIEVILRDLKTRRHAARSAQLSELVHQNMLRSAQSIDDDVRSNGVRKDLLLLLLAADMPSMLIEVGYLSNRRERERLLDARYQQALATGIAAGVKAFVQ